MFRITRNKHKQKQKAEAKADHWQKTIVITSKRQTRGKLTQGLRFLYFSFYCTGLYKKMQVAKQEKNILHSGVQRMTYKVWKPKEGNYFVIWWQSCNFCQTAAGWIDCGWGRCCLLVYFGLRADISLHRHHWCSVKGYQMMLGVV